MAARIHCHMRVLVVSDQSDEDTVFMEGGTSGSVTGQHVRWSHYQPMTWMKLLDERYHEMLVGF